MSEWVSERVSEWVSEKVTTREAIASKNMYACEYASVSPKKKTVGFKQGQ